MEAMWKLQPLHLILVCYVSLSTSYDVGFTYNYKYESRVWANQLQAPPSTSRITFQLQADVAATNIWQNSANDYLLLLQVTSPALLVIPKGGDVSGGEVKAHQSDLENFRDKTLVVHFVNGLIVDLYADNEQSQFVDIKAGIASLFQLHLKALERDETDSSGKCRVTYGISGNTVIKKKFNCQSPFSDLSRSHPNPLLRGVLNSEVKTTYEVTKDNVISSVESVETQTYEAVVLKTSGSFFHSQQKLTLLGQDDGTKLVVKRNTVKDAIKGLTKVIGLSLKKTDFHIKGDIAPKTEQQCKNFVDVITKRRSSFSTSNLAKYSSAATFMNILQHARSCSKESITKILKNGKNKDILPQLLDIFAATETTASTEAVLEFLKLESKSTPADLSERFLASLASSPFPQQTALNSLLILLEKNPQNQKVYETLLLTVGSLVKNYRINAAKYDETVDRVLKYLTNKLKGCNNQQCKLPYLRALQQTGLADCLPSLLDVIAEGGTAVSEAIVALRHLPKASLTDQVKDALVDVYFMLKKKHDASARMAAAESLLLMNPNMELIRDLISSFNKTVTHEIATFVLSKMRDIASRDPIFKEKLLKVLENPKLRNYHILGQTGFSVAEVFSVPEIPYVNASYEVKAEFLRAGVFKRSILGATMSSNEDTFHLLNFGTFAGGLASFAGEPQSDDEKDEEMTAGLELNVMGIAVRPYTLFTGQGEVMGLLWSGAGSETTPIFQAILKLHDNKEVISLQNGLKLEISLQGAASIDLSGSVQVSLWSRNSHSEVKNSFAIILKHSAIIETSYIDARVEVTTAIDAALDFITDSDFSDTPLKSCMLFQHQPFQIKQLVSKLEKVPGTARKLRRSVRRKYHVPGRCFALNRRVFQMCSQMNPN